LTAPKIIINDGAAFRGRIDMQNFDEGHESKSESKSEARPEPAPKAAAAPSGDQPSAAAAK
jgi:hypothetical protein